MENLPLILLVSFLDPARVLICLAAGWWIANRWVALAVALGVGLMAALLLGLTSGIQLLCMVITTVAWTLSLHAFRSARRKSGEKKIDVAGSSPSSAVDVALEDATKAAMPAYVVVRDVLAKLAASFAFAGDYDAEDVAHDVIARVAAARPDLTQAHPLALAALALANAMESVYVDASSIRNACGTALGEVLKTATALHTPFNAADLNILKVAERMFFQWAKRPMPIADALERLASPQDA